MNSDELLAWAATILHAEGHGDWSIRHSLPGPIEGITMFKTKEIIIHWPRVEPDYALMLHEIAHVCVGRGGHDSEFAHQYMRLVRTYLWPRVELPEEEI